MGLYIFRSSSMYDRPAYTPEKAPEKLPNPDPHNYVINGIEKFVGRFMILDVTYPDCTNYEGRKILLYKDVKLRDLEEQGSIDPHFSDNKDFHSPIARFEPTLDGLQMAFTLAKALMENV